MVDLVPLFFLLAILAIADECGGNSHGTTGVFDFYVFQQEWEAAYCYKDSSAGGCLDPTQYMLNNFTIHGLWPQYNQSVDGYWWPQCCPSPYDSTLDQSTVDTLYEPLHLYWPDVDATPWPTYTYSSFWNHEWGKHGTCSGLDQVSYMSAAMSVGMMFPVPREVIDNAGGSIDRSIIDAYYNGGKACTPKVDCPVALGCDGGKYFSTVTSCWDQNLEQIPCIPYVLSEDNCPTSGVVYIDAWNVKDPDLK